MTLTMRRVVLSRTKAGPNAHPALVEAARAGDRAAFGDLYDRYRPLVHGILLAYVPYADVEDLMQNVFLQAMGKLANLRQAESFGAWLAAIARHQALDFLRQSKLQVSLEVEPVAATRPTAEAQIALEALQSLPEAYRETLILRLVEGMTGPEIASRTGLTPDSVRVNLCRGMKLLRERLGG